MKLLINWIKRMIELIQGTTSTPVDDVRRQEIPSRLAIEKGIQPDEAVTVAQISGGDGISVQQLDGFDDNYNLDLKARGNILINKETLIIEPYIDTTILPYLIIENTAESVKMQYGKLIEKSVIIINGVEYSYHNWFVIGTYEINGFTHHAIKWLGNDMFELEKTDSITLRI